MTRSIDTAGEQPTEALHGQAVVHGRQLLLLPFRSALLVDVDNVALRKNRMRVWLRALRKAAGCVDVAIGSGTPQELAAHGPACEEAGIQLLPAMPGPDGADRVLIEIGLNDTLPGATVMVASGDASFAALAEAGLDLVVLTPRPDTVSLRLRARARAVLEVRALAENLREKLH